MAKFGDFDHERLFRAVARMAREADVHAAVVDNHDENRWWPTRIEDPCLRMLVAGWSARVSYQMVGKYAEVVASADRIGFDTLTLMDDHALVELVRPIGLPTARIEYLRSLNLFLKSLNSGGASPLTMNASEFIHCFAEQVSFASYKVAQCAALYSRGYHCGIIPIDSGMVTRLAPILGIELPRGAIAHERMREILEANVKLFELDYRQLIQSLKYSVRVPVDRAPTWWVHLVLIYFKRLYCNRPSVRLCRSRPACDELLDCDCLGT